jgi:hypothetical protein
VTIQAHFDSTSSIIITCHCAYAYAYHRIDHVVCVFIKYSLPSGRRLCHNRNHRCSLTQLAACRIHIALVVWGGRILKGQCGIFGQHVVRSLPDAATGLISMPCLLENVTVELTYRLRTYVPG